MTAASKYGIKLELIHSHTLESTEGGVARAKVVDGALHTCRVKLLDHALHLIVILHSEALGQLESDKAIGDTVFFLVTDIEVDEVILRCGNARYVHRNGNDGLAALYCVADKLKHLYVYEMVELGNEAVGLEERNELAREHIITLTGIKPTNECLDAVDAVLGNVVLRLHEDLELAILQRGFHYSLDALVTHDLVVDLLGKEVIGLIYVKLGRLCRHNGALDHLLCATTAVLPDAIDTDVIAEPDSTGNEELVTVGHRLEQVYL